jgi:nickel transport protein
VPGRVIKRFMIERFLMCAAIAAGLVLLAGPAAIRPARAHGTGYRISDRKSLSLEFSYSTGETMSYLEAKVFSPRDEKFAFQSGRTDEDGRFAFTPNAPGLWRLVVRDEEGHLAEAKVEVTPEFLAGGEAAGPDTPDSGAPKGWGLALRAVLGVSLIFNIAAFVSLRRRGKAA